MEKCDNLIRLYIEILKEELLVECLAGELECKNITADKVRIELYSRTFMFLTIYDDESVILLSVESMNRVRDTKTFRRIVRDRYREFKLLSNESVG